MWKNLKYAESIFNSVRESLVIMNADLKIVSVNQSFCRTFQVIPEDVEGHLFYGTDNHQWNIPYLRELLGKIISENTTIDDYEITHDFAGIGQKTMLLNARRIDENSKTSMILLAIEDLTERKKAEEALQRTNYKLHAMVYEYGVRYQRLSLFNQMSEQLQTCISLEETYSIISQFAQKLFPAAAGAMFMLDSTRSLAEAVAFWGKALSGEKTFITNDCCALREGKLHKMADSPPDSYCRHLFGVEGINSLCVPLLAQGEILGMLHLQYPVRSSSAKPEFDEISEGINEDEQQLAVTVAGHLALALANIKLRDTLKQQAIRDPLTGLFNRRYMEETLNREIQSAERHETPLGIIMVDLDHFRRFNNTFGHDAGDLVLKDMGNFLRSNLRKEDVACRFGGEEFTLILPGASLDITQKRAELLRHTVQYLQIFYNDKPLNGITLSLGVAIFPDHGSTGESVLQAADVALYSAKRKGRNRVAVADNTIIGA